MESSQKILVRSFQREDQSQVEHLYLAGLQSYTSENSIAEVPLITRRFATARCEPGGDMHDIEASFMKGDRRSRFFVAVDTEENKIVGCVGVIPSTEFDLNEYLEVVRMSVDDRCRGAGIGAKLMTSVESWAKENGYQKLNLTTLDGMRAAVKFYTKNGFRLHEEKIERLDLSKYGIVETEKTNAVSVVHFVKNLD